MICEVVIRRALPADINSLASLLKSLFEIEADFVFDIKKQCAGLRMMLEDEECRCLLVAEANGEVIGICSAQLLVSTAEGGLKALVEDVVLADGYRGRGIGRRLLAALEEWALTKGVKRLDLVADRYNTAALQFYANNSWQSTKLVALQKKI